MDNSLITPVITFMHSLSGEAMSCVLFLSCIISILLLLRLFGYMGLFLYNIVIVIASNIQVIKLSDFWLTSEPVALGTVTFATAFLTSDILAEHYGKKIAIQGVWLTFSAQILMTIMMVLTLGYKPSSADQAHAAMETLFSPAPRLLIASLISFACSQLFEIAVFQRLRIMTNGHLLWLRTNISTIFSAFLDNIIFSVLAWVILSPAPVDLQTLVFTYILGTYLARIIVSIFSTPVMYLSYSFLPSAEENNKLAYKKI